MWEDGTPISVAAEHMGAAESSSSAEEPAELQAPNLWKSRVSRFVPDAARLCQPVPESFDFAPEDHVRDCKLALEDNARLALLRYQLVPSQLEEAAFWRALFYQLSLPDDDEGMAVVLPPPMERPRTPPEQRGGSAAAAATSSSSPPQPPDSPPTTTVPMPPIDFEYFGEKSDAGFLLVPSPGTVKGD